MKEIIANSAITPATAIYEEELIKQFSSYIQPSSEIEISPNKERFDIFCQILKATLLSSPKLITLFSKACDVKTDVEAVLALLHQLPRLLPNPILVFQEVFTSLTFQVIAKVYFIVKHHGSFLTNTWPLPQTAIPERRSLTLMLLDIFHKKFMEYIWFLKLPLYENEPEGDSADDSMRKALLLFHANQREGCAVDARYILPLHTRLSSPLSLFFFTAIYSKCSPHIVEENKANKFIARLKQECTIENLQSATIKPEAAYELLALLYWAVSASVDPEALSQFNHIISYLENILAPVELCDLHDRQPCADIILLHQNRRLATNQPNSNINIKNIALWLKQTCSPALVAALVSEEDLGGLFWALCTVNENMPVLPLDHKNLEARASIQAECTMLQGVFQAISKAGVIKDFNKCTIGDKGHIFLQASLLKILSVDDPACLQALYACMPRLASSQVVKTLFEENLNELRMTEMMARLFEDNSRNWDKRLLDVALTVFNAPDCAFWLYNNIAENNYHWLSNPGRLFQVLLQKEALAEILTFVQKCKNSFMVMFDEVMQIVRLGIQTEANPKEWPENIFNLALPYHSNHCSSATELIRHLKIEEDAAGENSSLFCERFCAQLQENSAKFAVLSARENEPKIPRKIKKWPAEKQMHIETIQTGITQRKAQQIFDGMQQLALFERIPQIATDMNGDVFRTILAQLIKYTSITSQAIYNVLIEDPHVKLMTALPLHLIRETYTNQKISRKLSFIELLITSFEISILQDQWQNSRNYILIIVSVFTYLQGASRQFPFSDNIRLWTIFFTLLKNLQVAAEKNNPQIASDLKKTIMTEILPIIILGDLLNFLWNSVPLPILQFIGGYLNENDNKHFNNAIQQQTELLFQKELDKASLDLEALRQMECNGPRQKAKYQAAVIKAFQAPKNKALILLADAKDNACYLDACIESGAMLDNLPFTDCAAVISRSYLSASQKTRVLKAMQDKLLDLITPQFLPPTVPWLILLPLENRQELWRMVLTKMQQKEDFSLGDYETCFKEACHQEIAEEIREEIIKKLKSLNFNAETTSLTWATSVGHSPLARLYLAEVTQENTLLQRPIEINENLSVRALLEILAVVRLQIKPGASLSPALQKLDIRCAVAFAKKKLNYLSEAIKNNDWRLVFCLARNLKDFSKQIDYHSSDFISLFTKTMQHAIEDRTFPPLLNVLVQGMLERKLPVSPQLTSLLTDSMISTLCNHICDITEKEEKAEEDKRADFTATYLFFMNQWQAEKWNAPMVCSPTTLLEISRKLNLERATQLLQPLLEPQPSEIKALLSHPLPKASKVEPSHLEQCIVRFKWLARRPMLQPQHLMILSDFLQNSIPSKYYKELWDWGIEHSLFSVLNAVLLQIPKADVLIYQLLDQLQPKQIFMLNNHCRDQGYFFWGTLEEQRKKTLFHWINTRLLKTLETISVKQLIDLNWLAPNFEILQMNIYANGNASYVSNLLLTGMARRCAWPIDAAEILPWVTRCGSPMSRYILTAHPDADDTLKEQVLKRFRTECPQTALQQWQISESSAYELLALLFWLEAKDLTEEIDYLERKMGPGPWHESRYDNIIIQHEKRKALTKIDLWTLEYFDTLRYTCSKKLFSFWIERTNNPKAPAVEFLSTFEITETVQYEQRPIILGVMHFRRQQISELLLAIFQVISTHSSETAAFDKSINQIGLFQHIIAAILMTDDDICLNEFIRCWPLINNAMPVETLFEQKFTDNKDLIQIHFSTLGVKDQLPLEAALGKFNAPRCAYIMFKFLKQKQYQNFLYPHLLLEILIANHDINAALQFLKIRNNFFIDGETLMKMVSLASITEQNTLLPLAIPYQNSHVESKTWRSLLEEYFGKRAIQASQNILFSPTLKNSAKAPSRKKHSKQDEALHQALANGSENTLNYLKTRSEAAVKKHLSQPPRGSQVSEDPIKFLELLCMDPHCALFAETLSLNINIISALSKRITIPAIGRPLSFIEALLTLWEISFIENDWPKATRYFSLLIDVFIYFQNNPQTLTYEPYWGISFFKMLYAFDKTVAGKIENLEQLQQNMLKKLPQINYLIQNMWHLVPAAIHEFIVRCGYSVPKDEKAWLDILEKKSLEALRDEDVSLIEEYLSMRCTIYRDAIHRRLAEQANKDVCLTFKTSDNVYYIAAIFEKNPDPALLSPLSFKQLCDLLKHPELLRLQQKNDVTEAIKKKFSVFDVATLHSLADLRGIAEDEEIKIWDHLLSILSTPGIDKTQELIYAIYQEACAQEVHSNILQLFNGMLSRPLDLSQSPAFTALGIPSLGSSYYLDWEGTEKPFMMALQQCTQDQINKVSFNCLGTWIFCLEKLYKHLPSQDFMPLVAVEQMILNSFFKPKNIAEVVDGFTTGKTRIAFLIYIFTRTEDLQHYLCTCDNAFITIFKIAVEQTIQETPDNHLLMRMLEFIISYKLDIFDSLQTVFNDSVKMIKVCKEILTQKDAAEPQKNDATWLFLVENSLLQTLPLPPEAKPSLINRLLLQALAMDRKRTASLLLEALPEKMVKEQIASNPQIKVLADQVVAYKTQAALALQLNLATDIPETTTVLASTGIVHNPIQTAACTTDTTISNDTTEIERIVAAANEEPITLVEKLQPTAVQEPVCLLAEPAAAVQTQASFVPEPIKEEPVVIPATPLSAKEFLSSLRMNSANTKASIAAQGIITISPIRFINNLQWGYVHNDLNLIRLKRFTNILSFLSPKHYLALLQRSVYQCDVDAVFALIMSLIMPRSYGFLKDILKQFPFFSLLLINAIIYKNQSLLPTNRSTEYASQIDKLLYYLRALILKELNTIPNKIFSQYFFREQNAPNHIVHLLYDPVVTSYLFDRASYADLWPTDAIEKFSWCTGPRSFMSLFILSIHSQQEEPFKERVRRRFATECSVEKLQKMHIHENAAYELLTLLDWLNTSEHNDFREQITYLRSQIAHCPMRELHKEALYSATILRNPEGSEELEDTWRAWLLWMTRSPELLHEFFTQPKINKFLIFWCITIFFARSSINHDSRMPLTENFRRFLLSKINILLTAFFHHINDAIAKNITHRDHYIAITFLHNEAERKNYLQLLLSTIIRSDSEQCLAQFVSFLRNVENEDMVQALLLDPLSSVTPFNVPFFKGNQNALDMALQSCCAPRCALFLNQIWDNTQYTKIYNASLLFTLLLQRKDVTGLQKFLTHRILNFYVSFTSIMQLIPLLIFKAEPVCIREIAMLAAAYSKIYFHSQARSHIIQSFKASCQAEKYSLTEAAIEQGADLFFQTLDGLTPTTEIRLAVLTFDSKDAIEKAYQQVQTGHLALLCKDPQVADFENHLNATLILTLATHLTLPEIGRPMPFLEALLTFWEPVLTATSDFEKSQNYFLLLAKVFCVFHDNPKLICYEPFLLSLFLQHTQVFHNKHQQQPHVDKRIKNILPQVLSKHISEEALVLIPHTTLIYLCTYLSSYDSIYLRIYNQYMHVSAAKSHRSENSRQTVDHIEEIQEDDKSFFDGSLASHRRLSGPL